MRIGRNHMNMTKGSYIKYHKVKRKHVCPLQSYSSFSLKIDQSYDLKNSSRGQGGDMKKWEYLKY